jgi:hypothetical protein
VGWAARRLLGSLAFCEAAPGDSARRDRERRKEHRPRDTDETLARPRMAPHRTAGARESPSARRRRERSIGAPALAPCGARKEVEMNVVTMIDGKATALNAAQLAQHIQSKANRAIQANNLNACANAILAHPGGNGAGGALNGVHHHGNAVYHESRNLGAVGQRCSVFFTDSGNGYAKLLAVGEHMGQQGAGHPVYSLDWVASDWGAGARWKAGGTVTL